MAGQTGRGLRWPLEFTVETHAGVPVVTAIGRVSHASAEPLALTLDQARGGSPGAPGLILDLKRVDYLSSGGLEAIESAVDRMAGFVLVAPQEPVRIALDLAGLLTRVAIEPTREAALERLNRQSGNR